MKNLVNKYGTEATIRELNEKRRAMDIESEVLERKLVALKIRKEQFDKCDQDVIKNYLSIREKLMAQKWAIDNMNRSVASVESVEGPAIAGPNLTTGSLDSLDMSQ